MFAQYSPPFRVGVLLQKFSTVQHEVALLTETGAAPASALILRGVEVVPEVPLDGLPGLGDASQASQGMDGESVGQPTYNNSIKAF